MITIYNNVIKSKHHKEKARLLVLCLLKLMEFSKRSHALYINFPEELVNLILSCVTLLTIFVY